MLTVNLVPCPSWLATVTVPPVSGRVFLNARETDAGSVVRPRPRVTDAMKPLEHASQILLANADARIGHGEIDVIAAPSLLDTDFAFEGELERVRQQVEDDLLPHVAVHIYEVGQWRTVDGQDETSLLDRGTECTGEIGGQCRQIGGLVARIDSSGLDTGKVEKRVHKTQQSQRVAMGGLDTFVTDRRAGRRVGQLVFERTHQ
jgi:hypothetical protein